MFSFNGAARQPAHRARRPRGISLIEALVALAVMAFGILGVAGLQGTLRSNADIARQRAEAVRLAQAALEGWRAYTTLAATLPTGHTRSFDQIATIGRSVVASPETNPSLNTTYYLSRSVLPNDALGYRAVMVRVDWVDRSGAAQEVVLNTQIAALLPELAGTLAISPRAAATGQANARHVQIPTGAVDRGDGTSTFRTPGSDSSPTWVFSNATGMITSICSPYPSSCTAGNYALLHGFVRFATGSSNPTLANAASPTSSSFSLNVEASTTQPTGGTADCREERESNYIEYFCAVPLPLASPLAWTGTSRLSDSDITSSVTETRSDRYRVCRYTQLWVANGFINDVDINVKHPATYTNVSTSLSNQNFLVIRAGNGSGTAFTCPAQTPTPNAPTAVSDPRVPAPTQAGHTLPHQQS